MFGSGRDLVNSGYYDQWKTSPPEPDPKMKAGECACGCDEEIYAGDDIYKLGDGRIILADHWAEFAKEELDAVRIDAEVEEPDYDDRGY